MFNINNNNMRQISLLFVMLLSMMGVTQVKAQVTDDFTSYPTTSSGQTLGDNWYVYPGEDGNYGRFGSDYTYKKNTYDGADYNYVSGYSSNYSKNVWLVLKKQVSGSVSFRSKMGRNSGTLYVTNKVTDTGDGTFTVDKSGAQSYSITTTASNNTYDAGASATYVAFCLTSDQMRLLDVTYTEYVVSDGPALKVTGDTDGTLNFGMVNPGETKELTLSNPGTADITVNITTTGGFTADASKTIAAGGEETIVVAAPSTIGASTGKITITPTVDTVEPVEIALSCIIKDPEKLFEDFSGNALPNDWTSTGSWSFANGYAYGGNNTSLQLTTPAMVFYADETFAFDAAGSSSWEPGYGSSYAGTVTVQISTDGQTFTDLQSFTGIHYNEWQNFSVTIPEGTKYVRFVSKYASIDNVYGGKFDTTPRPKLAVDGIENGGSLSWGYSDVPAGDTKTITLKNDGTADLDVTIDATDDYTVDPATATIAAGGTVEVTVGTPAHDGNGTLTITPAEGSGLSPYTISLSSYYKEPKPVMAIDKTSIAFGRVNAVTSETITVSNTGDADLVVTIANDNAENFSVDPADQLIVAPGEEGTVTITYHFVDGTWGTFNANVKLTPNYGGTYDVKTIAVSATSKDPNAWDEDFEEGSIPANWIADGWTVSTPGSYSGGNGTKMAGGNSKTATLITPRLIATEGQELTLELGGADSSYPLTVEYSTDRETWETVASFTENGTQTIAAPTTTSNFYLRFTGWVYIDNLAGFKLDLPAHDAVITTTTIPATGAQFAEYTASVTVKEQAGKAEELTAKFFIGETQYGDDVVETVNANGTKTYTVTFTPEEAISGDAYFTVTNENIELTSEKKAVEFAAAPVFDEMAANDAIVTGNEAAVLVKYTAKAGWNTIALPFALTEDILTQIFGKGWKAYEFNGYTDGALSFKPATFFSAGYPYVVYSEAPVANENGFVVNNVNVSAATANSDSYGGATLQATYAPIAAPDMAGKYGVVPSTGKIQKGSDKASLKGLRAYFELPADAEGSKLMMVFMDEDGSTTSINGVEAIAADNAEAFDLNGRKLNGQKSGIIIKNGKKVVVK